MPNFKEKLLKESIRAIYKADRTILFRDECHEMVYDPETNGIWYILNKKEQVIPMVISWIFVSLSSLAGIAFNEENYEKLDDLSNRK